MPSADGSHSNSPSATNRKDHWTPQGYLRGFVHPDRRDPQKYPKPLWVFDAIRAAWSERSTSEIGWARGFYDYPPNSQPDATADDAFRRLENEFPRVRDTIRTEGVEGWVRHRELLISFATMLGARSRLFRAQTVAGILPSLTGRPDAQVLAKNYSITTMRHEMDRRAAEYSTYDWSLAFTTDPETPFITGDQAVGMRGGVESQKEAYRTNDLWLWCPLSWELCLIGSSRRLDSKPTSELRLEHIQELQRLTRAQSELFVVSPVRLEW